MSGQEIGEDRLIEIERDVGVLGRFPAKGELAPWEVESLVRAYRSERLRNELRPARFLQTVGTIEIVRFGEIPQMPSCFANLRAVILSHPDGDKIAIDAGGFAGTQHRAIVVNQIGSEVNEVNDYVAGILAAADELRAARQTGDRRL